MHSIKERRKNFMLFYKKDKIKKQREEKEKKNQIYMKKKFK